jgi:hypothetical protein
MSKSSQCDPSRPESSHTPIINRHTPRNVAHRHADEQARQNAAHAEPDVPHLPPPAHRLLAAKLNGGSAENQGHEQQNERQVKAGEDRRVNIGERRKQRAAPSDQPDFIAVPHRADGVEHDAPFLIRLGEQMQRADAQVEAVQHSVAGEQHADENEPGRVEIERAEVHALLLSGSASFPAGIRSASSGPCWILSLSKYTKTANSST